MISNLKNDITKKLQFYLKNVIYKKFLFNLKMNNKKQILITGGRIFGKAL